LLDDHSFSTLLKDINKVKSETLTSTSKILKLHIKDIYIWALICMMKITEAYQSVVCIYIDYLIKYVIRYIQCTYKD